MSKFIKKVLGDVASDAIGALLFGIIGVILMVIGTYTWEPLVFVGVIFIIIGLFIAGILF